MRQEDTAPTPAPPLTLNTDIHFKGKKFLIIYKEGKGSETSQNCYLEPHKKDAFHVYGIYFDLKKGCVYLEHCNRKIS
jgi:hypothetical protein